MKILLVNPSLLSSDVGHYSKEIERKRGCYPPLGLCNIAGVLRKEGHEVRIHDCDAMGSDDLLFERLLKDFRPDIAGMYTMTWTYRNAVKLADIVRRLIPSAKTIAGGPNVTSFPEETLKYGKFDFAFAGEAEHIITKLVESISTGRSLEECPGLIYRTNGKITVNPIEPNFGDLDAIPFPARDLIKAGRYFDILSSKKRFTTMVTSRGCPFSCIYCDRKNRMGRKWRAYSAKKIVDEMERCKEEFGVEEVMFFDDEFVLDRQRIFELCELLLERDLGMVWECRARVDQVDEDMLRAMKKAGCYRIRFGFESGNDRMLKILKKGISVRQSEECSNLVKRLGIEVFGYFMLGIPGETESEVAETLNLSHSLGLDFAVYSKAILIPGSELFEWGVANGHISEDYWSRFLRGEETNGAPAISTEKLPEERVDELIHRANKKFFLRPRFVVKNIKRVMDIERWGSYAGIGRSILLGSSVKNK